MTRSGRRSHNLRYTRDWGTPPVIGEVNEICFEEEIFTYLVLDVDVQVLSPVMIDLFAAYDPKLRHPSIPSRHPATSVLRTEIDDWSLAAAAVAASACPHSRALTNKSRME